MLCFAFKFDLWERFDWTNVLWKIYCRLDSSDGCWMARRIASWHNVPRLPVWSCYVAATSAFVHAPPSSLASLPRTVPCQPVHARETAPRGSMKMCVWLRCTAAVLDRRSLQAHLKVERSALEAKSTASCNPSQGGVEKICTNSHKIFCGYWCKFFSTPPSYP